MHRIAIIGGTGNLGKGLGFRLASSYDVMIGSRDRSKASRIASELSSELGTKLSGDTNETIAQTCDSAILATPAMADEFMTPQLVRALAGKLVISATVPMKFQDGVYVYTLETGSAAERAAQYLKESKVVAAFHTVPAPKLLKKEELLDYDVFVAANSRAQFDEVSPIISAVRNLRPLYAGPLRVAHLIESLTPFILNIGKQNRLRSPSLRVV
jgi:NADPH-dependent F420 reductase